LLPRQRDPLVLLALLRLLVNGARVSSYELSYGYQDVLKLLGWGNTEQARDEIDEAVRRYTLLTLEWKMSRAELSRASLSYYMASQKIISESYRRKEVAQGSGTVRVLNRIIFNLNFIERLLSHALFGLDWRTVRSLKMAYC
jgi:hypothetical protein